MVRVIFNEIPLISVGLYEILILRMYYICINHINILETPTHTFYYFKVQYSCEMFLLKINNILMG